MNLKALVAISALIAIVFISGCIGQDSSTTTTTQVADGYQTWESQKYGIRVHYPSNWAVTEDYMGTVVYFSAGLENEDDLFADNFNIAMGQLENNTVTLEQQVSNSFNLVESLYNNVSLIGSNNYLVNGIPAREITYTLSQGVYDFRIIQTYMLYEGLVYVITYNSEGLDMGEHSEKFYDVVQSFEIF